MKPLVSVVAPVFNGEKFIRNFIESILAQTYNNWELIIVDDGSTDQTPAIVDEYATSRKNIKFLRRPNNMLKGADTCRNIGQENVEGKYFIVLDSDDVVKKFCLEQRVNFMEKNQEIDFAIFPGYTLAYQNDGSLEVTSKKYGIKNKINPLVSLLKADYNFGVWNLIFKASTLKEHKWDEKLKIYMDFDYIFGLLTGNYTYKYAENATPDYGYIQGRANAITASFVTQDKYDSTIYLFNKTLNILKKLDDESYVYDYYYFFLSFYRKIMHSNNLEMYYDYYNYFLKTYANASNKRLRLINHLVTSELQRGKAINKALDKIFVILFYPQRITDKCKKILGKNN